jgi:hypothetical protein
MNFNDQKREKMTTYLSISRPSSELFWDFPSSLSSCSILLLTNLSSHLHVKRLGRLNSCTSVDQQHSTRRVPLMLVYQSHRIHYWGNCPNWDCLWRPKFWGDVRSPSWLSRLVAERREFVYPSRVNAEGTAQHCLLIFPPLSYNRQVFDDGYNFCRKSLPFASPIMDLKIITLWWRTGAVWGIGRRVSTPRPSKNSTS